MSEHEEIDGNVDGRVGRDPGAEFPDIPEMSYEAAREELVSIVGRLEAGELPLAESMTLWRRGEALAAHCTAWLDGAQAELADRRRGPEAAGVS